MVEYAMTDAEMFGLIPDDVDTKFGKQHVDARDIETINHIADQREQHMR